MIRAIHASGHNVLTEILRHGIASEAIAYEIEASVIDAYRAIGRDLTNLVLGHRVRERGWASTDVVSSLYDAPPCPDITESVVLLRIPRRWTPDMSPEALYETTRGWWAVNRRGPGVKANYAFAISRQVIREVYRIEKWRERVAGDRDAAQDGPEKKRLGFIGTPAPEMVHYKNTSAARFFLPGNRGLLYLNCGGLATSKEVLRGQAAAEWAIREPRSHRMPTD